MTTVSGPLHGDSLSEPLQESSERKPKCTCRFPGVTPVTAGAAELNCPVHGETLFKKLTEVGRICPVQISPSPPTFQPQSSAETVLREWVDFLKTQLEHKRLWFEQELEEARRREKFQEQKFTAALMERDEFRVALAEACNDIRWLARNTQNYSMEDIDRWEKLIR